MRWERRALARLCSRQRTLVLTYDDGPGPRFTPRLLELLAAHDAHATFFLLGRHAARAPHLVERVLAAGHEIGSHSYAHLDAWHVLPWRAAEDVRRGFRTLAPWLGPRPLFRPPHGRTTPITRAIARRHGSRLAWWTVDSGDTWARPPRLEQLLRGVERRRGGVVRMHELDADEGRQSLVLRATDALLQLAGRRGLRVTRMCELFEDPR